MHIGAEPNFRGRNLCKRFGILDYVCQNGDIQVDVLLTESPFDDADEESIFPGKFHKVGEFVSLLHNAIIVA